MGRLSMHRESSMCYEGHTSGAENQNQCPPDSVLCSGGAVTN